MKYLILILLLSSCTKGEIIEVKHNHCELCIELSYKYNLDSSFIRLDTLYKGRLCDSTLNVFRSEASKQDTSLFRLCGLNMLEKRRFVYKP